MGGWLAEPEADARAALLAARMSLIIALGRRDASSASSAAIDATAAQHRLQLMDAARASQLSASDAKRVARDKSAADYVEEHRKDPAKRPPASLLGEHEFAVSDRDFRWDQGLAGPGSKSRSKSKSKSKPKK